VVVPFLLPTSDQPASSKKKLVPLVNYNRRACKNNMIILPYSMA